MVNKPTGLDVTEDADGNEIIPPAPSTDAAQLVYLLEWARVRGFRLGPAIRIGGLTLQVQDLRQTEGRNLPGLPEIDPWEAAGHREE